LNNVSDDEPAKIKRGKSQNDSHQHHEYLDHQFFVFLQYIEHILSSTRDSALNLNHLAGLYKGEEKRVNALLAKPL
jgi:hypothetical protein